MQINKFVAIGAIASVSIGAIAWVNSVKYEEEKKAARSEAKVSEVGCLSYPYSLSYVQQDEDRVKENPNNEKYKEYLRKSKEEAEKDKKACEKIEEYKNKYEN